MDAGLWTLLILFIWFVVFFFVDLWLHLQGLDTVFWNYKTEAEKELQKKIIERYGKKGRN